jgi:hypothetical protein
MQSAKSKETDFRVVSSITLTGMEADGIPDGRIFDQYTSILYAEDNPFIYPNIFIWRNVGVGWEIYNQNEPIDPKNILYTAPDSEFPPRNPVDWTPVNGLGAATLVYNNVDTDPDTLDFRAKSFADLVTQATESNLASGRGVKLRPDGLVGESGLYSWRKINSITPAQAAVLARYWGETTAFVKDLDGTYATNEDGSVEVDDTRI